MHCRKPLGAPVSRMRREFCYNIVIITAWQVTRSSKTGNCPMVLAIAQRPQVSAQVTRIMRSDSSGVMRWPLLGECIFDPGVGFERGESGCAEQAAPS